MPWEKQFDVDEALDRAMQVFWSTGYQATSMQDIVERTGVNRASLYSIYKDKRALFLAALHRYDEHHRQELLKDLEARYSPRDAIHQLFLGFASHTSPGRGNRGCFMTNTAIELAAHDAEIRSIVAAAQQDLEAFFARMIKKGRDAGDIGAHVNPQDAARGLLAALLGLLVLVRSRPEPTLMATVVADAMNRLR